MSLLLEDFAAVGSSKSAEALRGSIEQLTAELEFERYALHYVVPQLDGGFQWVNLENVPEAYREAWQDPAAGKGCPVMQHAKHSSLPLYWNQETYVRAGEKCIPKWEQQAPFGYGAGFIVASHLPDGRHVVVSLEREKELADTPANLAHKLGAFQLFAMYAVDACVTVLGEEASSLCDCPLTKREIEALQWTLKGKTAWESGRLMQISERTVAQHVSTASHKLGTVNKVQAAMKALRLGWIS